MPMHVTTNVSGRRRTAFPSVWSNVYIGLQISSAAISQHSMLITKPVSCAGGGRASKGGRCPSLPRLS